MEPPFTIADVMNLIEDELRGAMQRFEPMNSLHEGYAVLLEEVDELWDEVKVKQGKRDMLKIRKESVQVAAMAARIILDCTEVDR